MGAAARQREKGDKMKKQIVSILFALCMVLCLVPLAAFAEGETVVVCEVTNQADLFAAVDDTTVTTVKLTADIDINATLTVSRKVTLDLNGFVLKYQNDSTRGSVIKVESTGNLTLVDSNPTNVHKFDKSAMPWTLAADDAVGENIVDVPGGIITGGMGTVVDTGKGLSCGGGVYIDKNGIFTMTGGSIVGCTANWFGGGVYVGGDYDGSYAQFSMSGKSLIAGCLADGRNTGGVYGGGLANYGQAKLSGSAKIQACNAVGAGSGNSNAGGAIFSVWGSLNISDNVTVIDCDADGQNTVMDIAKPCNISGGTFYGMICLNDKQTTITGGTFYGEFIGDSLNDATIKDSAKVAVTFTTNGGSAVDTQNILRGQKATKPVSDPTKEGYTFLGWYNGTEAYDFNLPVTEPITLTAKWMAGTGTPDDPYLISNAEELKIFHDIVNGENGRTQKLDACATLTADIVLNDGTFDENGNYTPGPSGAALTEWTPMGNRYEDAAYSGTFDGAGHTIQGLYCAATDNIVGLFGYTNGAVIKDVKVTGYLRVVNNFVGSIVASAGSTSITGCVNAAVINATGISSYYAGGIVASAYNTSTIRDCVNIGTLKCSIPADNAEGTGGIVGCLTTNSVISNCSNLGTIMGICSNAWYSGMNNIGGIVGSTWGATISDCYNIGLLTDTTNQTSWRNPYVGGIAGYSNSVISNCYNVGSVTATRTDSALGGIVGCSAGESITNCYYLTGTAGQVCGESDTASTVTNTTEKSAFDFANGDVLTLLMAGRPADIQPWDTTCKYLESAGMTLPVLAKQNLTVHDHAWTAYTTDTTAKTHTRSCACGVVETEACTITPATCKDVSACAVCGQQYGGLDPHNHAGLQHFPAVAATTDAEGNIEYWYCGDCGKYFADATAAKEITQADTVTAKLPQPTTPPTATPTPTASPTVQPTAAPQAAEQPRQTAQPTVQPTAAPTAQPVSTIPATADTSSPILWAALLLCSGMGLAVTVCRKNAL